MKFTYNWLKTFVDFDLSADELVHTLTMLGLEVDAMNNVSWEFDGIVVGEVLAKDRHANADKLSVCQVNVGSERLSIVCGAPNVDIGQKVPVARSGTRLPGGMVIKTTEIRGVESQGMICSESELGISNRADGIMVLENNVKPGQKLQEVLGKGDVVIDVDVTPNRPDCFGIVGIAREIAAVTGSPLKKPTLNIKENSAAISDLFKVTILDRDKCPRFTARFIGGVKVGPSPWWLAQRLDAVGIRPINNVVDVTNYVMMETGHPLHAYDYDLLSGKEIVVKTAEDGEEFTTLDEKTHKLNREFLMICDKERSVGIGGVMGGMNTEVSEKTENVLLECAYFNPVSIRRASKKLGYVTEASKRFERGVDPNGLRYALDRAAQLIATLSGGTIAKDAIDEYPNKMQPVRISLRRQRVHDLLGVDIQNKEIQSILSSLDFDVQGEEEFSVTVPTFRPDVTREADLIEEVARLYGYDNIPPDTTATIEQLGSRNVSEIMMGTLRTGLAAIGYSEVVTYSLIRKSYAELFAVGEAPIQLLNPLSEDLSTLRTSLLPGLLETLRWNINRKNTSLKIFEVGTAFTKNDKRPSESLRLSGAVTGSSLAESWQREEIQQSLYDVKGTAEYLLNRTKVKDWYFSPKESHPITDKTIAVEVEGQNIGFVGEIKKRILDDFDIEQPVFVFDFSFDAFLEHCEWDRKFKAIPRFPPIIRDIAIVVADSIDSESITKEISVNGGEFLQNIRIFDVYKGEQVGAGQKSLALTLTFYSLERTLTEKEVDQQISHILDSLSKKYSARLRD